MIISDVYQLEANILRYNYFGKYKSTNIELVGYTMQDSTRYH